MRQNTLQAVAIFVIAFLIRSIAAIATTLTTLNPDSTADAIGFGDTAETIAHGLKNGEPYLYTSESIDLSQFLIPLISSDIYTLWGTFLAPFWLLPGPSGFYARLGNAFLGAFAVYNVYLIARYYHSHQAGVIASIPVMFYPSIVATHSTLLREAIVLFAITTATRLLVIQSHRQSQYISYAFATALLHVALLMREENIFIYAAGIGTAIVVYGIKTDIISKRTAKLSTLLSPAILILSLPVIRDGIELLAYIRKARGHGRAVYLPEVIPQTPFELITFSWIGAAYFLYAPFPWMIETIPDFLVSAEGIATLGFTIAAAWGIRSLARKSAPVAAGLTVGILVAVLSYGVGTVNYGTGMRHRQMFSWVIYLFGGIGVSEIVHFESLVASISEQ